MSEKKYVALIGKVSRASNFIFKDKSLLDYTNLFSFNKYGRKKFKPTL